MAVGFEFQTNWQAFLKVPGSGQKLEFSKESVLYGGRGFHGWSMETDGKDIEFVVEPPIEESKRGRLQLASVFADLFNFLRKLEQCKNEEQLSARSHPQLFNSSFSARADKGEGVVIIPDKTGIRAQPQVTVGVRLDRIHVLLAELARLGAENVTDIFEREGGFGGERKGGFYARKAGDAAAAAGRAGTVRGRQPSHHLRGLVALTAQYLKSGAFPGRRAYAKDIAFAMSRTDFAAIFKKLPVHERQYFECEPKRWVEYVLEAAGMADTGTEPLIGQKVTDGGKISDGVSIPITRGMWLYEMARMFNPRDLFSAAGVGDAPGLIDVTGKHRFRAPGGLGARFDPVNHDRARNSWRHNGVVIELRQLKRDLPFEQWRVVADDILAYLIALNGSEGDETPHFK